MILPSNLNAKTNKNIKQSAVVIGTDICLDFLHQNLFKNLNFSIPNNQIIGLVGVNGAGKSTLLNILQSKIQIDSGKIQYQKGLKIEYVGQSFDNLNLDISIWDFIFKDLEKNLEEFIKVEDTLKILQTVFNLPDLKTKMKVLSGGEMRQVLILKALSQKPNLLLLDEPSNHLDPGIVYNLQLLLTSFEGSILLISHDRYFLDKVCHRIWELDNSQIFEYFGNYSEYIESKKERYRVLKVQYQKEAKELKRELDWVRQGVKARSTKDTGRLKRYYELEQKHESNKPVLNTLNLPIPKPEIMSQKILELKDISLDLPDGRPLIRNFSFKFSKRSETRDFRTKW
jgi:ABC transport system ATP-binding/permease protein